MYTRFTRSGKNDYRLFSYRPSFWRWSSCADGSSRPYAISKRSEEARYEALGGVDMKIGRAVIPLVLAIATTACLPPPKVKMTVSKFDPDEVEYIHQDGSNTIRGQAFLRQQGGGVVTCAGASVHLIPSGDYSRERMWNIYGTTHNPALSKVGNKAVDTPNAEYVNHTRKTLCDAQGNSPFRGLPTESISWRRWSLGR